MAFSSHRKQFKGILADVPVERLGELDYTKETLSERKKFLDDKYEEIGKFYETFTSGVENEEYYKVALNKDDDLSCEINIFKYSERDASYLLNSRDIPRDKKQEYNFLSEEDFREITKREKNFSCLSADAESDSENSVIDMLEPKKSNTYTNMEHKITKKDLKREDSGEVLTNYNDYRNYLMGEMDKIKRKESSNLNLYQIRRLLKDINDDMINSKIALQGIRNPAKKLGDESGKFYPEMIDYTCADHLKAILKMVRLDSDLEPDSELSHIAYDMRCAIEELYKKDELDDIDLEIIECYNVGYTNVAIAKEINRDEKVVRRRLIRVFNKISNYFKKS